MIRILLFLLLIPSIALAGFSVDGVTDPASVDTVATPASVGGVTSDYATTDWSTIGFFWRCEDTTLDSSLDRYGLNNSGDSTATAASAAAIDSGTYKYGSNSCDYPTPADYFSFTVSDTQFRSSEGRFGFWFLFTAWEDGKNIFILQYDVNNRITVSMYNGDGLSFAWTDNSTARTSLQDADCGLTNSGTWYYLEFAWKTSTNYRQIFVNGAAQDSSSETINTFASAIDEAWLGESVGGGATDQHHDNYIFSTDSTKDLYTIFSAKTYYGEP